eukprot:9484269-Pyramimonas_sp.AAC.1
MFTVLAGLRLFAVLRLESVPGGLGRVADAAATGGGGPIPPLRLRLGGGVPGGGPGGVKALCCWRTRVHQPGGYRPGGQWGGDGRGDPRELHRDNGADRDQSLRGVLH